MIKSRIWKALRAKRTLCKAGGLFLLILALSGGAVYAARSAAVSVENHISTGDIRIRLTEYEEREDGLRQPYQNDRLVQPADRVSKIPVLTNEANASYVRFRTEFSSGRDDGSGGEKEQTYPDMPETLPELFGIGTDWIFAGGWYYRIAPLLNGEACELFQGLVIPEAWTSDMADLPFSLTVIAEGIQAANFTPDYTLENPWKNVAIQTCIHESGGLVIRDIRTYHSLRIELDGNTGELLRVPEDFFCNLAESMPGDSVTDQIQLKNRSRWPAELFFRTELPGDLTAEEEALLSCYRLKLLLGNTVLYDGPLHGEALRQEISLGICEAGESGTLRFQLDLPSDCDNSIALLSTRTIWCFRAAWEETASSGFGSVPLTGRPSSGQSLLGSLFIRTGLSEWKIELLLILLLLTGGTLGVLHYVKVRRKKK